MAVWEKALKDSATILSDLQAIDSGITDFEYDGDYLQITTSSSSLTQTQLDNLANYNGQAMRQLS